MFKNIIWDFLGKFSVQLISFGITVVLTRMISPSEFGVMGMAMAIIVIAHLFLDLGFNRAIIQQKEVLPVQYATIFYLNAGIALLLTGGCYFLAAPLAQFYHEPLIRPVFRVLSVVFLVNGLNLVPSAILYKRLMFRLNSILNITSSIIGGVAGIIMAYQGYGIWSLVAQSIITSVIVLLTNFIFAGWFPVRAFSFKAIRPLWAYGSRMFASGLLDNVYTRLDIFIIGRIFSTSMLGFYTRAQSMDSFIRQLSVNSIMGAIFPYIAQHQDDRGYLKALYQRYLHMIGFISIALSGTLFLTAKYVFLILFTARWQFSASLFQLMSIVGFAWPVSSLMCNIITGVGNSEAFLRLEVYKKLLFLPVYLFGFLLGLKGFLWFFIAANFIGVTLNAVFVSKEIEMSTIKQLRIVLSYFSIGGITVGVLYFIGSMLIITTNPFINLLVYGFSFNTIFFLICYLLKLEAFQSILTLKTKLYTYIYDKRNKNFSTSI